MSLRMCWSDWFHSLATQVFGESLARLPLSCPIQKLPHELLVIIFRHAISSSPSPKSVSYTQTLLSQVSKQWNAIISSTPSLWTQVPIVPYQSAHALRSFLRNSSSLPISVTVHPWPVKSTQAAIQSLDVQLHTLLGAQKDCERITSLTIEATGFDDLVNCALDTWTGACGDWQMLALESIYLKGGTHTVWDGSRFFTRAIAPSLHTLVVEDIPLGWFQGTRKCSSPLSVTTLVWRHSPDFDSVTTLEFAQLVSAFPGVTTVQLVGPVVEPEGRRYLESRFGTPVPDKLSSPLYPLSVGGVTTLHITDGSEVPASPMDPFHLFRSFTGTFDLSISATRDVPTTTQPRPSTVQQVPVQPEDVSCEINF